MTRRIFIYRLIKKFLTCICHIKRCRRCGLCCQVLFSTDNYWSDHTHYTKEQLDLLWRERNKYPPKKGQCEMVIFEGKIAVCLIHRFLGYEYKPKACKDYPKDGELCIGEINGSGNKKEVF
jgi:hypothetical protein